MKNSSAVLLTAACICSWTHHAAAAELGRNLAGETCQVATAAVPDAPAVITCGQSADSAGQIWMIPADRPLPTGANARRDAILRLIASESEDSALTCSATHSTNSGDAVLRICALRSSGWPQIVFGAARNGRVYRAQGAPALLPVLEKAVASDAGTPFVASDTDALERGLRQNFSDGVLKATAADYAGYGKLVEDGRMAAADHDYAGAESDYRHALAVEEQLFGRDAAVVGETLAELALEVSNQGRFAEAAALFRRARVIIESSADKDLRARLDSYMALDAANARNYKSALTYAAAATAERRNALAAGETSNIGSGDVTAPTALSDNGELAHSLRIEAEMALRLGDLALARATSEEALRIVTEQPGLPLWWRAGTVSLMGEVNEADGRVVQAEHDFRDARDLDHTLFGDTAPTALADFTLAEFYGRQQLYPAALDAFRAGFDIAKKDRAARAEIQPEVLAEFAAAENAADGKVSTDGASELFRDTQLSTSGVVEQSIARMAVRAPVSKPELSDLVARAGQAERERDRAQVELAAEYAKLDEERDMGREQRLAANVKDASAAAEGLDQKVQKEFPEYSDLTHPAPVGLDAAQSKLAPGEALIVYLVGTRSSYALVVRAKSFAAIPLAATRDALAADVENLRGGLRPTLGRLPAFNLQGAYQLYRRLIGPLQVQLAGADHLIIVPGPALASLPFDTLVVQPPLPGHEHDYLHAAWLPRQFGLSTVPSSRALVSLREAKRQEIVARRPFLGVGAPAFHGSTGAQGGRALSELTAGCREQGAVSPSLLSALPPLPETAAEVQAVAARVGNGEGVVLLGERATESNFRSQPLDQYAVIYLATHGILPGELRCASEPALAFSPPSIATANVDSDGLLGASDTAQLKLNADLVVLSACNTGVDPEGPGGESLEGLSDAFVVAGAHAVLASHWEIASASTKTLMTDLFARAQNGAALADALRQSQLDLIGVQQTSHPFYWAAFTLMGDGGPLKGSAAQRTAQITSRSGS